MSANTQNDSSSYLLAVERQNEQRRVLIAELAAEVAEVRELNRKLGINNDRLQSDLLAISFIAGDSNVTIEAIKDIARNALKEGV